MKAYVGVFSIPERTYRSLAFVCSTADKALRAGERIAEGQPVSWTSYDGDDGQVWFYDFSFDNGMSKIGARVRVEEHEMDKDDVETE